MEAIESRSAGARFGCSVVASGSFPGPGVSCDGPQCYSDLSTEYVRTYICKGGCGSRSCASLYWGEGCKPPSKHVILVCSVLFIPDCRQ